MTLHEAIARSVGNKAKTIMHKGDGSFTLVVQEPDMMVFRWWVIESDGHVWENKDGRIDCMTHLRDHGQDQRTIGGFQLRVMRENNE